VLSGLPLKRRPVERGRTKLTRRRGLIVANDITRADAGFDADTNAVTIISKDSEDTIALTPKADIAVRIWTARSMVLKAQGSGLTA